MSLEMAAQVLDVELIIAFGGKDLIFNKLMDCLCFGFNSRSCCLSSLTLTLCPFRFQCPLVIAIQLSSMSQWISHVLKKGVNTSDLAPACHFGIATGADSAGLGPSFSRSVTTRSASWRSRRLSPRIRVMWPNEELRRVTKRYKGI